MSDISDGPLILALDAPSAQLAQVGGKGASLAHLAMAGLPVPPGFHITTAAYRRFVTANDLQARILSAASAVTVDQPDTLETASRQISAMFAAAEMPEEIAEAIHQSYAAFGGEDVSVAVRSSATAEDLPDMSFAGQQETYLNLHGTTMILDAVKRCWASLWTARAIGYRARQGIASEDVSLAVVVQELVPADVAGVLFTANPLTGARDQVMINAVWGLGEAMVSGQVTPDSFIVDKASGKIAEQHINEKLVMTARTNDGTREEAVPPAQRARATLSPEQAVALARMGKRIEDLYGCPIDIEWAIHADRIFVVQARPITALPESPAVSRPPHVNEWQLPDPKGRYVRSSVFELLPDPLSPLFATLGLPAWARATTELFKIAGMADFFPEEFLVTLNGYGYYDITMTPAQMAKIALAMPRLLVLMLAFMRTSQPRWQAARARYASVVNEWQTRDLANMPAERLFDGANAITTEAARYYLSVQSGILPAAYLSESIFTLAYNRFFKGQHAPPALKFLLGFDSAPLRAEKSLYDLASWVRGQPELAAALAAMSSEQFAAAYHEQRADGAWPTFWQLLAAHLARFGHTIYDLDFAKPVLAEDPVPLLETLKFFVSGQAPDPYQRQAEAQAAREDAMRNATKHVSGVFLRLFRYLVGTAQRFAPLREDALADVGLGWPVLRRMLREVGQRLTLANVLAVPDDIFWLKLNEVQGATAALDAGQTITDYHAVLADRHATWQRQRALTPPVALPPKEGARFLGFDFSRMMPARTDQPIGEALHGIAASPGSITGAARVIHGPGEFAQMRQGEILVARITTPAWTPLFALAAGIITDVGGPLSHGSIVAREYHIPAVLGTGVATERIHSGQRVTVDGDTGIVTLS